MSKFLAAIAALIVLLAAIILLAPMLLPVEAYKGRVESAASEALGRTVTLGDDLSFSIFPKTSFHVTYLVVANPEGFDAEYFAKVETADIRVQLLPLFSQTVVIDNFVLTRPQIELEKNTVGAVNWQLGGETSADDQTPQGAGDAIRDFRPGLIRIVDGRARFADNGADQVYDIADVNLDIRMASLFEPLEVAGEMVFEGSPADMNFVLTTPAAIRDGKTANLKFDMTIATSKIGGDLEIAEGEDFSYAGPVSLSAPDLAALASIFGIDLSDTAGFDRLEARGEAKGDASQISLSGAAIEFDKIKGTGDIQLAWNGARPKASGALDVGVLDLRPYMPPPPADSDGFPAWSSQNIDFSSLKNIDAEFDVQAEKIFLNNMETGEARLDLTVAAGRMTAEMPQLSLYGGGGSGRIVIDASRTTPAISGAFDFGAVNAENFSKDVLSTDRLLGLGGVRVQFTAAGANQKAIMSSLNGKGGFDLADGAVKGVNIVKIAQAVAKLGEGGIVNPAAITAAIAEARRPSEQTDYSKFLSQFSMTNGVLNAPTISLEGPYLTMNGQGVIDLANQTVDLRLAPRATTSADGVEGRYLTVPMRISGTFSEPKISVDAESLLRDRVDSIGRDVLKGVLGGAASQGEDEADAPSTPEEAAKSLLEGVFGGSKRDAPAEEDDSAPGTETNAENTSVENIARDALGGLFGRNKGATQDQDEAQSADEASPE